MKANFDANSLYSTYAVLGQHKGSDLEFGRQASQDKSIKTNAFVGRYRLLVAKDTGRAQRKVQNIYRAMKKSSEKPNIFLIRIRYRDGGSV